MRTPLSPSCVPVASHCSAAHSVPHSICFCCSCCADRVPSSFRRNSFIMPPCMGSAFICGWQACDMDNITVCCIGKSECLCCVGEHCLAKDEKPLGMGMVTADGEICKLGLNCCTCGLKQPQVCCNTFERCLCCSSAESFPMTPDSYVSVPHCAYYCLACAPECGCCVAPAKDLPIDLKGTMPEPKGAPAGTEMAR
jgi:hypothetical protein